MKAFPNYYYQLNEEGMDLRDYFAAKALSGYVAKMGPNPLAKESVCANLNLNFDTNAEALAYSCYLLADAMMKAREK